MSSWVRPGRVGGAGEAAAAGQRIDQRRLADVGPAGEGDLRRADRRQAVGTRGGEDKVAWAGEQLSPGFDPVGFGHCGRGAQTGHHTRTRRITKALFVPHRGLCGEKSAAHVDVLAGGALDGAGAAGPLLRPNIFLTLSNSSIFTPAFFMMNDCWRIVSVLFHVQ